MLGHDERMALVSYCRTHAVAVCPGCAEILKADEIAADIVLGKHDFCPRCRTDLTAVLRQHLTECTWRRVQERETRERAREVRQQAQELSKTSQGLRDRADVLAREAEAAQERACDTTRGTPRSAEGQ